MSRNPSTTSQNPDELALRRRLRDDLPYYAEKALKIRDKRKDLVPLKLNAPQRYIHERLEQQLAEKGFVRALILKGRKQGASTYIGARCYHKTTHTPGWETAIIAHEAKASKTLFAMAKRFHHHCPDPIKPVTSHSNAKELIFSGMDAGYSVLTAGAKDAGRSSTPMSLHGSEVAFWPNAEDIFSGLVQAVPMEPGTEIVLESTANGLGNEFHKRWQQAEAGEGDYIAIFVPWFWSGEYRREPEDEFRLTEEEAEHAALHGLDRAQMCWRRAKIAELGDVKFKQEYPATAAEAFQSTGEDAYIQPGPVLRARKASLQGIGPKYLGVDPARSEKPGADRFGLIRRQGRKAYDKESWHGVDIVTAAGRIRGIIDGEDIDAVFIDVGGLGIGVYDTLVAFGPKYAAICHPVNFGGKPRQPLRYAKGKEIPGPKNRRSELWMDGKAWLDDIAGADIPDDDELQADICAPGYTYDTNQRVVLEPKEKMKARGLRSPDLGDAWALTFADPAAGARESGVEATMRRLQEAERTAPARGSYMGA